MHLFISMLKYAYIYSDTYYKNIVPTLIIATIKADVLESMLIYMYLVQKILN